MKNKKYFIGVSLALLTMMLMFLFYFFDETWNVYLKILGIVLSFLIVLSIIVKLLLPKKIADKILSYLWDFFEELTRGVRF